MSELTPLGALVRGLAAGAAGTAAMTAAQTLPSKLRSSGEQSSGEEREGEAGGGGPSDPWEQASAPAQVVRKVARGVFDRDLPPSAIPAVTQGMHWGYGTSWGAVFGLVQGSRDGGALPAGVLFGTVVWAASYAQLVPMGLYSPPWTYSPRELARDIGYHLAYGAGLGAGWALLRRLGGRSR